MENPLKSDWSEPFYTPSAFIFRLLIHAPSSLLLTYSLSCEHTKQLGHHEKNRNPNVLSQELNPYFNLFSPTSFFVAILIPYLTMHITTAAATHGPDYYQGLLAQSEDEVIKPDRALGTQEGITRMRNAWRRYISLSTMITFN